MFDGLDFDQILKTVERAAEQRARELAHRQWCALLPQMSVGLLKYVSFEEYYDRITGGTMDMRPAEEIIAEVAKIREEMNGTV